MKAKYLTMTALSIMGFVSCRSLEDKLLESKVYFEQTMIPVEIYDDDIWNYALKSRLSSSCDNNVTVEYISGDYKMVENFNKKHGTEYVFPEASQISLEETRSVINKGNLYASPVQLSIKGLGNMEEGKEFLLPVKVKSSDKEVIDGNDIVYFILKKPIRIMNVATFAGSSIRVPILPSTKFKSVTYEALINVKSFGGNNTVMGGEGVLIFRIGDTGGGLARNLIQIAGGKQFNATTKFESNRWYHVAFTYDNSTGKARIYINGEKAAESEWSVPSFDLSTGAGGFFIGKVAGFMWGERPFYGTMSEVRIWNVARTEKQISTCMLNVAPDTEGLVVYYKLDGKDQYLSEDGKYYIRNISGYKESNMDGLCNLGRGKLGFETLAEPVSVK